MSKRQHQNHVILFAFFVAGTAHCANMYEPKDTDFPQLKEARNKIREFLKKILN